MKLPFVSVIISSIFGLFMQATAKTVACEEKNSRPILIRIIILYRRRPTSWLLIVVASLRECAVCAVRV